MDKLEELFNQIREIAIKPNEDKIILNVYHSLLSFFRDTLVKEMETYGKTTDYVQGIVATLNEMERLYPCIKKWRNEHENNL